MATASHLDVLVARVAATQCGVISRRQLAELDCRRSALDRRVRRGFLTPLSGAFVVAGSPASFGQRGWAALLGTGVAGAVLSHRTAAHLLGFDGYGEPGVIDVTVPPGRFRCHEGVRYHRSPVLGGDRVRVHGLPMTSGARTVIDLARTVGRSELLAAVDSAVRDRRTSAAQLRRRLAHLRGPGRHGVRLLDAVLSGRPAGGLHSDVERVFHDLVVRAGVPLPSSQVVHRTASGGLVRVDFLFGEHDTIVEIDGHAGHSSRPARRRDARRVRALHRQGRPVLPFTSDEVYFEPESVIEELRALFG